MSMNITRFNPTTNGPLHVGHAYSALVNEHLARSSGGKFLVRFDDNQRIWRDQLGAQAMQEIANGQLEDLEWLGLCPDEVAYQSEMEPEVLQILARSHWRHVIDYSPSDSDTGPVIVSDPPIEAWGLSAYLVAEKVVLDHMQGVTLMVRGLELLQENALYHYICALLGFPFPGCVYVPRLREQSGGSLSGISKTKGNWKLHTLREQGVTPVEVLRILCESCLVDSGGRWHSDNLKTAPRIRRENVSSAR